MNDAGNFLIETCDETVSRDLKQQLLLLNGRWRELFVKVKHVNISFKQRISHLTCICICLHSSMQGQQDFFIFFPSFLVCKSG